VKSKGQCLDGVRAAASAGSRINKRSAAATGAGARDGSGLLRRAPGARCIARSSEDKVPLGAFLCCWPALNMAISTAALQGRGGAGEVNRGPPLRPQDARLPASATSDQQGPSTCAANPYLQTAPLSRIERIEAAEEAHLQPSMASFHCFSARSPRRHPLAGR